MGNRLLASVMLLISIVFLWESREVAQSSGGYTVSAAFFPRLILWILIGLSIWLLIKSFIVKSEERFFASIKAYGLVHWRVGVMTILMLVYLFVIPRVGFLLASSLFLLVATLLLYQRYSKRIVSSVMVVSLLLPSAVNWIFQTVLRIYLP